MRELSASEINGHIQELTERLLKLQQPDGTWRFGYENGILTDAYMIITLRVLQLDDEPLIKQLHKRILSTQQPNGAWKVYPDETEGNLSATVEAYYALLFSRYSHPSEPAIAKAKQFILSKGGLGQVDQVLTKIILAVTGQYPWPSTFYIPLELLLLPSSAPVSFFDFSSYARVHLAAMLLLVDQKKVIAAVAAPDLSDLMGSRPGSSLLQEPPGRGFLDLLEEIKNGISKLSGLPHALHQAAESRAEQYMLDRIEPDGTLYNYATATFLMIYALLVLGYDKRHVVIARAIQGLKGMVYHTGSTTYLQNSPSTVWDTSLLSHALQESGIAPAHSAVQHAAHFVLTKQQHTLGDWSIRNRNPVPGGWGFSENNTIHPDVDDTTSALRALKPQLGLGSSYRDAWNKGLQWVLSMQNDDGGWASFEKNTDLELLTWLPVEGAKAVAIDPSSADLTGRTLEFLGGSARLHLQHPFIRRAVNWLIDHQGEDGSWYGRWGVCYIYGTWAALTGMRAVGVEPDHPAIHKAVQWLHRIQNHDGGWGESCRSDRQQRYIPLGESTPSQTAWAIDALISVHASTTPQIDQGVRRLTALLHEHDWKSTYPTGSGLPGFFYNHYHSYNYIWPLYALSHYRNKYI